MAQRAIPAGAGIAGHALGQGGDLALQSGTGGGINPPEGHKAIVIFGKALSCRQLGRRTSGVSGILPQCADQVLLLSETRL